MIYIGRSSYRYRGTSDEIIELYKEGKIKYIGVSNFTLDECKKVKEDSEASGISLTECRIITVLFVDWEKNGLRSGAKIITFSLGMGSSRRDSGRPENTEEIYDEVCV